MSNILFSKVNIPMLDSNQAIKDVLNIDTKKWFWDSYRATNMLPLMTKGGQGGMEGTSNKNDNEFLWVSYTPNVIKNWFEDHVFPWMGMKSRVMLLKTEPNFSNREHIDCDEHQIGSRQHKFRVVLKGRVDTLYFITDKGTVNVPNIDGPFIMDGGWPHGMNNFTNEIKLTLAVGAPWNGKENYENTVDLMFKSQYNLPVDINQYLKN